jgi:hypothetical protein
MRKNFYLLLSATLFSFVAAAQTPTAAIALWKNDAKGAYSVIHDDYGDVGVDGIWQYADTMYYNRSLKFTFGAITSSCEALRTVKGYASPFAYAKSVMIEQHGHEIINHSHTHTCALNRGWSPCDITGWGEDVGSTEWSTQMVTSTQSILTNTNVAPRFFIYPYDQFTDTANAKLFSLGYIGSRTGWSVDGAHEPFGRYGYDRNDLSDFAPNAAGFFRTSVKVFNDVDRSKNDAGQIATLNLSVDSAITYGGWCNRELHNVGNSGWGAVRTAPYRTHLNYVKTKVNNGDLWVGTVSEVLTYQMQKLKFTASASYDVNSEITTVTFADAHPEIAVNVANYLAPLEVKTPATVIVDMDGMDETWVVMQNSTSITDFTKKNGKLYINVYPHLGELQIFKSSLTSVYENSVTQRKLYPNPAVNELHIEGNVYQATIYDIEGSEVLQANNNTIDISDLNDGVYMVRIDASPVYFKFVKCTK